MDKNLDKVIEYYIAEIESINEDIQRRSGEQFRCVITSIIALGAIIGAVSQSDRSLWDLLIVIPWVHSVLGILWTDHSWAIIRATIYIKFVERKIRSINSRALGVQSYISFHRTASLSSGRNPSYIISLFPLIFFIGPSVAATAAYLAVLDISDIEQEEILALILLAFGIVFTVFLFMSWRRAQKSILMTESLEQFEEFLVENSAEIAD